MKLLRYKKGDLIQPGILDKENKVRNVSSLVKDWNNLTISGENLNIINNSDLSLMPIVDEDITIEEIDNFLKSKNYILKKKIYADDIAINEIWKFNEK